MEMTNFTVVSKVLRNNDWFCLVIGLYRFWVISPRNSTLFTRPFLAGRCMWAGDETSNGSPSLSHQGVDWWTSCVIPRCLTLFVACYIRYRSNEKLGGAWGWIVLAHTRLTSFHSLQILSFVRLHAHPKMLKNVSVWLQLVYTASYNSTAIKLVSLFSKDWNFLHK